MAAAVRALSADTLAGTVPLNVIVLEFDPVLRIGEAEMRLETLGLAIVLVISLLVAASVARAVPTAEGVGRRGSRLRADDLLFITMGALPGAVIGGRLGYVLLHLDYYSAHQAYVVDPAYGSLELTLGVVGGVLSAVYVLRLLDAPLGRWAHAAIFPLLLALGAGKLVQVLGGDGQGSPTDLPWGTLYVGDGPWGSLGAEIASHPSQVYEGVAVLVLLQLMTILVARGAFRVPDGSALLVGLGLWALIRAAVATTWRDSAVVGPLRVEQLLALSLAGACAAILIARRWAGRRALAAVEAAPTPTADAIEEKPSTTGDEPAGEPTAVAGHAAAAGELTAEQAELTAEQAEPTSAGATPTSAPPGPTTSPAER